MKKLFFFFAALLVVLFTACEDKTPRLNQTELTLTTTDSFQLQYLYYEGAIEWKTDNQYIANVENGLVKAMLAGETYIYANELECKVTVNPRYNFFLDPFIKWGATTDEIEAYMAGYTLTSNADDMITYEVESEYVTQYMYAMENNTLAAVGLVINNAKMEEIAQHMMDRYIVVDIDDQSGMVIFLNPTMTDIIMLMPMSEANSLLIYSPYTEEESPRRAQSKAKQHFQIQEVPAFNATKFFVK